MSFILTIFFMFYDIIKQNNSYSSELKLSNYFLLRDSKNIVLVCCFLPLRNLRWINTNLKNINYVMKHLATLRL